MGRMTKPMQTVAIMQEFGWSWEDYQNTPNYILTLATEKLRIDQKTRELEAKRTNIG